MNKTTRPVRSTLLFTCSLLIVASAGCSLGQALVDGLFLGVSDAVAATLTDALGTGDADE